MNQICNKIMVAPRTLRVANFFKTEAGEMVDQGPENSNFMTVYLVRSFLSFLFTLVRKGLGLQET